nr:hypothetical protein B0A51_03720 [Rachicladosporium sp. CCFEE 5018]
MARQSFRFLDLPPEIRVLTYELLCPPATIYMQISRAVYTWRAGYAHKVPSLRSSSLCLNLLRTCRLIYSEALPVVYKHTTFDVEILESEPKYGDIMGRRQCWLQDFVLGSRIQNLYLRAPVPDDVDGAKSKHASVIVTVLQKFTSRGPASRVHLEMSPPAYAWYEAPQPIMKCFEPLSGSECFTAYFGNARRGKPGESMEATRECEGTAKAMGASKSTEVQLVQGNGCKDEDQENG